MVVGLWREAAWWRTRRDFGSLCDILYFCVCSCLSAGRAAAAETRKKNTRVRFAIEALISLYLPVRGGSKR